MKNKNDCNTMVDLFYTMKNKSKEPLSYNPLNPRLCADHRPCFARNEKNLCDALAYTYPPGECPFQKEKNGGSS